jgi:hypothetical protein
VENFFQNSIARGPITCSIEDMKREKADIFLRIKLYAIEIASTAVLLVFLYVAAGYEITLLLAK